MNRTINGIPIPMNFLSRIPKEKELRDRFLCCLRDAYNKAERIQVCKGVTVAKATIVGKDMCWLLFPKSNLITGLAYSWVGDEPKRNSIEGPYLCAQRFASGAFCHVCIDTADHRHFGYPIGRVMESRGYGKCPLGRVAPRVRGH